MSLLNLIEDWSRYVKGIRAAITWTECDATIVALIAAALALAVLLF